MWGGGDADEAINKNDEKIIALALPDPPTQQPTDDDDAEGMTIKKRGQRRWEGDIREEGKKGVRCREKTTITTSSLSFWLLPQHNNQHMMVTRRRGKDDKGKG